MGKDKELFLEQGRIHTYIHTYEYSKVSLDDILFPLDYGDLTVELLTINMINISLFNIVYTSDS